MSWAPTPGSTLWEARSDGSQLHLLLPNWESRAGYVDRDDGGSWTPEGRYYLFRSVRREIYGIWALHEGRRFLGLFDQHPVLIHSTPSEIVYPVPSPDGKRVFFISGQGRSQFARYDAGRSEFVRFLPGTAGRWISFSKDGRWLAYTGVPQDALWRGRLRQQRADELQVAGHVRIH